MKKFISIIAIAVLAVSMLTMVSCGKSEFSGSVDDEKHMTVNAVKADKGDFYVTGTLVVDEGEEIAIEPDLESGSIDLEFISSEGLDNGEELPEVDTDNAAYSAHLTGADAQTIGFGAGSFLVKATVTEKATGTINITVQGVQ